MNKKDFEILKEKSGAMDEQNENDDQDNSLKNKESQNRRKVLCNKNREELLKLMNVCLEKLNEDISEDSLDSEELFFVHERLKESVEIYKILKEES